MLWRCVCGCPGKRNAGFPQANGFDLTIVSHSRQLSREHYGHVHLGDTPEVDVRFVELLASFPSCLKEALCPRVGLYSRRRGDATSQGRAHGGKPLSLARTIQ